MISFHARPCTTQIKAASFMMGAFIMVFFVTPGQAVSQNEGENLEKTVGSPFVYTIDDAEVNGLEGIEKRVVLDKFPKNPNKIYTQEDLDTFLKTLFSTGLFQDVQLNVVGRKLKIQVKNNPIINQISFEGTSALKDEDLLKAIPLKPRQALKDNMSQETVQILLDIYRAQGYSMARISCAMIERKNHRIDVVLKIEEGSKSYIHDIVFIGNKAYEPHILSKVVSSCPKQWWHVISDPAETHYNPERIKFDEERLRKFYMKNGYADFTVSSSHAEILPQKKGFMITFVIEEGQRYFFGKTTLRSAVKGIKIDKLLHNIPWLNKKDQWFDDNAMERVCTKIYDELSENKSFFIQVIPIAKKRGNYIDIDFVIQPIEPQYAESITIRGNFGTNDDVIRRSLKFSVGSPLTRNRLKESEEILQNMGYFDNVEMTQAPGSTPDRQRITINLKEKSTGAIQFGAGYSTLESFFGQIGYTEQNFLGAGQFASASAYKSVESTELNLGLMTPYFLGRHINAGVAAGFSTYKRRTSAKDSEKVKFFRDKDKKKYKQQRVGVTFSADYALRQTIIQGWSYGIYHEFLTLRDQEINVILDDKAKDSLKSKPRVAVNPFNMLESHSEGIGGHHPENRGIFLKRESGKLKDKIKSLRYSPYIYDNLKGHESNWISSISHSIMLDHIKKQVGEPASGWQGKFKTRWTGVGGTINYLSNILSFAHYLPLNTRGSLMLKSEMSYGLIHKIGYMRFKDQFILDYNKFPGFEPSGIGPMDTRTDDALGGQQFYMGSAKLYYLLGTPGDIPLKAIVCLNVGSIWNSMFKGEHIASNDLRHRATAGIGLMATLPMLGTVGFIWTKSLKKEKTDTRQPFMIIFGQSL